MSWVYVYGVLHVFLWVLLFRLTFLPMSLRLVSSKYECVLCDGLASYMGVKSPVLNPVLQCVSSGFTGTLTRIKQVLQINKLIN